MKSFIALGFSILTLTTIGITRVVPTFFHDTNYDVEFNITAATEIPLFEWTDPATAVDDVELWKKSVERGTKLIADMKGSDQEAATLYDMGESAESPFDGDLKDKLREWALRQECNFDSTSSGHMLKKTFDELGLGTKSKSQKGPNECFQIEHHDSPAVEHYETNELPAKPNQRYKVCGKDYRITSAEHTIGVNAAGGAIFAMSAFWNRVNAAGGDVTNIKYFFVTIIINRETNKHIRRVLSTLTPPQDETHSWPGHEFSMDSDAGKALLGSPVGRWAGYFLIQHKRQLRGDKHFSKVRIFKSGGEGSLPYLLFYVEGHAQASRLEQGSVPGLGDLG
ncbi:uncharacterized protein K460DRAFT_382536 [Cucurbitaria berberidis CBS 394.84]|uniref:Uncharacterized protein n=1 Tax=Cucurbitaria berberidis CBS 394.84 TaxID=1168544 RepID=A0A9P4GTF6_9PLEO|nr:uncharacterized protein K460DRAFT_382536 [Cucurbitaria berberidis CBS 394.84]KAF1851007.1 hypothetical protein K460DRAFT_382536 [Cucurbitaria berberidis CBS 394.84]